MVKLKFFLFIGAVFIITTVVIDNKRNVESSKLEIVPIVAVLTNMVSYAHAEQNTFSAKIFYVFVKNRVTSVTQDIPPQLRTGIEILHPVS